MIPDVDAEIGTHPPEIELLSLDEHIKKERVDVNRLAENNLRWAWGGVYQGSFGLVIGKMNSELGGRFAEEVRTNVAKETDIYVRAQVFDPLADDLGSVSARGKRVILKQTGADNIIDESGKYALGYVDAMSFEVVVGVGGGKLGFKTIMRDVLLNDLTGEGKPAETFAHEVAHLGAMPDNNLSEMKKKAILVALTQLYLMDLVTGQFYRNDEKRADAVNRLSNSGVWMMMGEIVARVAQADFGYSSMMSNYQIKEEIINNYPDFANFYKEWHDESTLDAYIGAISTRAKVLSGLGLSGWEVARKILDRTIETGLFTKASLIQADQIIGVFDQVIANELGEPEINLYDSRLNEMSIWASKLAELRHLKLQRIVLEGVVEEAQEIWENGAELLDFGNKDDTKVVYLDRDIVDGGKRLGVRMILDRFSTSSEGRHLVLTRYISGFVEENWSQRGNELRPFMDQVSNIEVGRIARDFWDELDNDKKHHLAEMLTDGMAPEFGTETDLSHGQLAFDIWNRVIDYAVQNGMVDELDGNVYKNNLIVDFEHYRNTQVEEYLKGQMDTRFIGTVEALPRIRYGQLTTFKENLDTEFGNNWAEKVAEEVAKQPRLEEELGKMWPRWEQNNQICNIFSTAVGNRNFFMSGVIEGNMNDGEATGQLMSLVGFSEIVMTARTRREAAAICEMLRIMGGVYADLSVADAKIKI